MIVNKVLYDDLYEEDLASDAILNPGCEGYDFTKDYLILHCLMRKHDCKKVLEVSTHMGRGTAIIKNAIGNGTVMSLDLPYELRHLTKQYAVSSDGEDLVGSLCKLPYIQLRGDSLTYDFSQHEGIDGWFIDGEHDFEHVVVESAAAFASGARVIVWHDADMEEVVRGIISAVNNHPEYDVFFVDETRIAFALKKNS